MKRLLPELIADYRNRWRELRQQFRQWRSGERSEADSAVRRSGVAAAVATIREATKVALVVAAIGLLFVGLALVLRQNPAEKVSLRIIVEYYAALLFFRPRLRLAILCAWLLGTIGRSLGDIVEAIPYVIVWGGLGLFILAGVLDEMEKAERRYRRRRSRQSRPRPNYLTAVAHTKARYAGRCASCGHRFRAGMRIGRVPEVGWCCGRCTLSCCLPG